MPLATVPQVPLVEIEEPEISALPDGPAHPPLRLRARQAVASHFLTGAILSLITLAAILVDGYHPYSEDAGIYVGSLKKLAQPNLYPASGAFLAPYVRFSLFSHFGAWLVRVLHLPLESALFAMHFATTLLLVCGSYGLAKRCFSTPESRWCGTLLLAVCLSVPVAGTSLSIMDPYLTGRSFSTPFSLLAFCAVLDRSLWRVAGLLVLTTLFHPLMGAYATTFALVLWAANRRSWFGMGAIASGAVVIATILQYGQRYYVAPAAYQAAVATRTYFFLAGWHWYEILGLVAPVLLLALYGRSQRNKAQANGVTIALACVAMGGLSASISYLFCHFPDRSYRVAALQPLRPFLFVYCLLFVLFGGLLGEHLRKRKVWRWIALFVPLGIGLGLVQHSVYSGLEQVELPGRPSANPWHRAFDWVRINTDPDAVIALDADYIAAPYEDSIGFRALAERDTLADRSKDGGAAAVFPQLADRWLREQSATTGLNTIPDSERVSRLAPYNVSWIVLNGNAPTAFTCPFSTPTVKVCQLR